MDTIYVIFCYSTLWKHESDSSEFIITNLQKIAENNKNDKDILLEYSKYVAQKKLELTLAVYYTLSSFSEHL